MQKARVGTFQLSRATIVDCAMEEVRSAGFEALRPFWKETVAAAERSEPSSRRAEGC